MKTLLSALVGVLAGFVTPLLGGPNTALAAPADFFGGPYEAAAQKVRARFKCDDTRVSSGYWTCKTKINVGEGMGIADFEVTVRHYSAPLTGGVAEYRFKLPRRSLIRDTSFRGMVGFAKFFGDDVAAILNTEENHTLYVRGQDIFVANGFQFEVQEFSSSFAIIVRDNNSDRSKPSTIADYAPDEKDCTQIDGFPGWQARWSHTAASITPALKPVSQEYDLITGSFYIGPKEVTPSFRLPTGGGPVGSYVTVFVDQKPIYQGKWVEKRKPTCCTQYVDTKMPRDLLFAMASGKQGMVTISWDAEVKRVRAAGAFDLEYIGKAADKVIGGRFERSTAKKAGRCKGL
ncbi:MAG: hypothetical protein AAF986_10180 [Pseudomonadota bacterium]